MVYENDDSTAERILMDKLSTPMLGRRLLKVRWKAFAGLVGASEWYCAEIYHDAVGLSQENGD